MAGTMRTATADGLTAALLLILVASGCQPDAERPRGPLADVALTFAISLAEDEKDGVREALGRFTRETGASVTVAAVTGDDLPEKLKVEVRAGRPTIDLFAKDTLALRVLVDEDLVEDLSNVAIPEGVLPGMVPEPVDGKRYFLPFRPNVQVTYVNRTRFRNAGVAAPRTVEELRTVARALKASARGVPKVTLPLAEGGAAGVTITEWIVAFGGNPLLLNDAGSVRAFEFLQSLWAEAFWPARASWPSTIRRSTTCRGRRRGWLQTGRSPPRCSPSRTSSRASKSTRDGAGRSAPPTSSAGTSSGSPGGSGAGAARSPWLWPVS
jgi:ABC-type glycerol-3-phosphate transport system substrate-binding protein